MPNDFTVRRPSPRRTMTNEAIDQSGGQPTRESAPLGPIPSPYSPPEEGGTVVIRDARGQRIRRAY